MRKTTVRKDMETCINAIERLIKKKRKVDKPSLMREISFLREKYGLVKEDDESKEELNGDS